MNYLKYNIKKILFKLKKINNSIFCKINKKKFKHNIAIISCDKWINKVKEDLLLKFELNKLYINCDIISWQDNNVNYDKYDALIIRSVWGYQDYIKEFINWINKVKKPIYNEKNILKLNMNKYEQFKLLDKYDIPHIKTYFINKNNIDINKIIKLKKEYKNLVIKPIISGGGNNTYIISDDNIKNSININDIKDKYFDVLNDYNNCLMIQPYIEEIKEGELSIVVISSKISHAVIRYNNIFNNINQIVSIPLNKVDEKVLKIVKQCINIKEYNKHLYMRVDLIKENNEYKVMELELVEPQLFLDLRQNSKELKIMSKEILNKIK